jgi:hypothetical protein
MESEQPKHPILIWALTRKGEMVATFCANRAEAIEIGRANVASGAWRTWDAFEVPGQAQPVDVSHPIASDDESKTKPRPRILADWIPPVPTSITGTIEVGKLVATHDASKKLPRPRILANWTPPPAHARTRPAIPPVPSDAIKPLASHDKSKKVPRPRLLADWTAPAAPPIVPPVAADAINPLSSSDKPRHRPRQRIIPDTPPPLSRDDATE